MSFVFCETPMDKWSESLKVSVHPIQYIDLIIYSKYYGDIIPLATQPLSSHPQKAENAKLR